MRKIVILLLLALPMVMLAQGYHVASMRNFEICDAPNGKVVMSLPDCGDCSAFSFNVVASQNGWLKIDKQSFYPAETIVVNDEEVSNTQYTTLNGVAGECWVRCGDVITDYYRPGAMSTGAKCYASPSKTSKSKGVVNPIGILEVKGDWVKVKGHPGKKTKHGYNEFDYDRIVTGWMYKPHLSVDICGA